MVFVTSNLSAQSGKSVPQLFMGDSGRTVGAAYELDAENRPHAYGLPCISSLPLRLCLVSFLVRLSVRRKRLGVSRESRLSIGLFAPVATAFLNLYWAYFEFEYICKT